MPEWATDAWIFIPLRVHDLDELLVAHSVIRLERYDVVMSAVVIHHWGCQNGLDHDYVPKVMDRHLISDSGRLRDDAKLIGRHWAI